MWELQLKNHLVVSLSTSLEKQPHPFHIVLGITSSILTLTTFIFALIDLLEKQQLRKHCMPALKVFTCSMNPLCTDNTHDIGTRAFSLGSLEASKKACIKFFL